MRLKSVVLPAPLGPMMALIEPRGTLKLTPPTAWKPSKLLLRSRTSSNLAPPSEAAGCRLQRARDAAGKDAAVEDAEEPARETREDAGHDEGRQLVATHIDADELRALGILTDGGEHAAERRADDAAKEPEARGHEEKGEEIKILRRLVAAQDGQPRRRALHPVEGRVGNLRHPLLAARHLVPLEADGPDDLGEGQSQHGEVDPREAHAEEAEDEGEESGHEAPRGKGEQERDAGRLHENAGRVGADAEVGRVAEGHEPGVANEKVEAGGEERPDDDVVRQERVVARSRRRHEEGGTEHDKAPRNPGQHYSDSPAEAPAQSLQRPLFGRTARSVI